MFEMIVLDTHIWYWWINEEYSRFPNSWLAQIENADKIVVSPVQPVPFASIDDNFPKYPEL